MLPNNPDPKDPVEEANDNPADGGEFWDDHDIQGELIDIDEELLWQDASRSESTEHETDDDPNGGPVENLDVSPDELMAAWFPGRG